MFGKWNKEQRKELRWILIPCFLILVLQIIEVILHRSGLVLRTALQIGKGICIWTIAPSVMVVGFYRLFSSRAMARMCRLLSCILFLLIVGISYARLGIYLTTGECKTEEMTKDGYLMCTNYNGSWKTVWKPVMGIFRTPFEGWTEEEMGPRLSDKYGSGTVLVRELSNGDFLCQAFSSRTGVEPFYFQAENDYWLTSNFKTQLMKSDAVVFWKTRNRFAALIHYGDSDRLELSEEVNDPAYASDERRVLEIYCDSASDIPACAADLADWFLYVREDERYLTDEVRTYLDPLTEVYIFGEHKFYLQLDEIYEWIEQSSWTEMREALMEKLQEQYAFFARNGQSSSEEPKEWTEEEQKSALLEQYDGESFEKECLVGDGTIRYRMICVDAALGSRAYALLISIDGGASWQVQELNPFDGQMGMGIDFTFLTEEFGFASLMHNGGDEADLYVTEDGGHSYQLCIFESFSVELEDGYYYRPYDYPQMPYEEDGKIYVLCGQGADGDYAGGDAAGMAFYESVDHGHTFLYQGIRKKEE